MSNPNPHQVNNILMEMNGGRTLAAFQDEIEAVAEVVRSSFDSKATGSVTLKIKIKQASEDMVECATSISKTLPAKQLPNTSYFDGDNGTLHKRSPRQGDIEDVINIKEEA